MARRRCGSLEHVWRERLRRYHRDGGTVVRFCQQEGVSVASFYAWRRRLGLALLPVARRRRCSCRWRPAWVICGSTWARGS